MIIFTTTPNIGTVLKLDGQEFELVRVEPYFRLDGTPSTLLVWESTCPGCASTFEVKSGLKANAINRRCVGCKRVGKPVSGKRRRKVSVEVVCA
ncbi:hypothetical protein [Novosphingobium sp. B1]|uniref:hypothetical protein n=1 Tax=Novosphingobium sp. B1 TaxID=1938756 RepID=UPI00111C39DB|nr:hypothetical protein [Novosphingobium sp. B1]